MRSHLGDRGEDCDVSLRYSPPITEVDKKSVTVDTVPCRVLRAFTGVNSLSHHMSL